MRWLIFHPCNQSVDGIKRRELSQAYATMIIFNFAQDMP